MTIENTSYEAPFGAALPADNPHAVSVSMPLRSDVQRLFRDRDPDAWAMVETTYPRFGVHPFVREAVAFHGAEEDGRHTTALSSPQAAERLLREDTKGNLQEPAIGVNGTMTFLSFTPRSEDTLDEVILFKKVTGSVPSSRRAEDFLIDHGLRDERFGETIDPAANEASVAAELQRVYAPVEPEIILANSGMSAVAAAVEAIDEVREGRDTWILLGNLYRDTEDLVMSRHWGKTRVVRDATDVEKLEQLVESLGDQVAGVITEAPTNPLLQTPDLERIKEVLDDVPLVVDVSSAGSVLVDALPHADLVVESLTKFASGHGDIMMGSIAINPDSPHAAGLSGRLPRIVEPPYEGEVNRIAYELAGWKERAHETGRNVMLLGDFFEDHPKIKNMYWTGDGEAYRSYAKLARYPLVPAGLITLEIKRSMRPAYDALKLAKGPSFGTQFTLNTDFTGIVYPQELRTSETRAMLQRQTGLTRNMLRVSVGTEDPDLLRRHYEAALDG